MTDLTMCNETATFTFHATLQPFPLLFSLLFPNLSHPGLPVPAANSSTVTFHTFGDCPASVCQGLAAGPLPPRELISPNLLS